MQKITPTIPETITVHLGTPSSSAANVTVPFLDYVKNVASSEVYPTWEPSALRANILAIVSFALNRVYLEHYRSRGYAFDITSSTAYDQCFVNGRSTFDTIDRLADELFNDYLRRPGFIEPLSAKFCNGTTVTCEGLSQWGSQALARQGYNSVQILRSYYGENLEIVQDAPIKSKSPSYPGKALRVGSAGPDVVRIQYMLNRIAQNYPAIPRIYPVDGIFGPKTEQSVRSFQSIFNLVVDGIVGRATWYELTRLFVAVNRLAELRSEGQKLAIVQWNYPDILQEGSSGENVRKLQHMLSVLAQFITAIPAPPVTGQFDNATRRSVLAFQKWAGLSETGLVGDATWNRIYSEYTALQATLEREALPEAQFPGYDLAPGCCDAQQEVKP